MNEAERDLAVSVYEAIQAFSRYDDRGMQTAQYRVGISDLGFCSERTNRMLQQMDPDDTDLLPAFIGTALGDFIEQAMLKRWPHLIHQPEVTVTLVGERNTYTVPGHPDIVDPDGRVIDCKTTRGLEVPRRNGPSQQQQFQRHCYAKAAYEGGLFNDDISLEDVTVSNIWMDRAADDRELHVHTEPYNPAIVEQAAWWIDEVVYAYTTKQAARKEPPIEMCRKVCGFYEDCRAFDREAEGLLTDADVLAAVAMMDEARQMEREAKRLKDQAKPVLTGIEGSTGKFSVSWVHVNGTHVEFDRAPYDKLDVKPVK